MLPTGEIICALSGLPNLILLALSSLNSDLEVQSNTHPTRLSFSKETETSPPNPNPGLLLPWQLVPPPALGVMPWQTDRLTELLEVGPAPLTSGAKKR